jgi:hypothetical protein
MKRLAWLMVLLSPVVGSAAADPGFTGTWSGSFDIHFADGRVVHDTAWLVLQQSGVKVTGTVGPKADQQGPIRDVSARGNQVQFVADSTQGKVLRFVLKRDGDKLAGEATGDIGNDSVRVVISTQRAPSAVALTGEPLYQKVLALDTAMFDSFNKCADPAELAKHATFFDKDVEFYHDFGGLSLGVDTVIDSTRKNVCGQFRRELDVASFHVYPVPGFGAIATGTHRFCHTPTTCEGAAEFTMVWRQNGDVWQITRALSFGHRTENVPARTRGGR